MHFNDKRLERAARQLHTEIVTQKTVCLRRLGSGRAGEVRFGRLLRNGKVRMEALIEGVCRSIGSRSQGRHILLIEDTSEINYQAHAKRTTGLGTVGNGTDVGFFIHPVLAVDAHDGACLGLADVYVWQRTKAKAKNYQTLPIEEKESKRWIEAITNSKKRLSQATHSTIIADRESDMYEMWCRLPDERTDILVRACRDRAIETDTGKKLFSWMDQLPISGHVDIAVCATPKRHAHTARLSISFSPVTIRRPTNSTDQNAPKQVALWCIDVKETAESVVGTDAPIHWRLLTTYAVENQEDALQCVNWYKQRWHIEQVFRTLKKQGVDVESSLVEHGARLEKIAVLALSAAVHTLQLTLAREGNSARPASDCFEPEDYQFLEYVNKTQEGKTEKQKNPHKRHSLAWAAWIIARLGGWKGYTSEREPGPITMLHGLQAFANIQKGWKMALEMR